MRLSWMGADVVFLNITIVMLVTLSIVLLVVLLETVKVVSFEHERRKEVDQISEMCCCKNINLILWRKADRKKKR